MSLKQLMRPFIPRSLAAMRNRWRASRQNARYSSRGVEETFAEIYQRRLWGTNGQDYYSGAGSHERHIVQPYVEAVSKFLATFADRPDVVDLGCGDFNVGSRIRALCAGYVACDVVADLIQRNRAMFANQDVDFRTVNIAAESLPDGQVAFARQVLQHMSNGQIKALLPKLSRFRWLVLTEHLPLDPAFVPNLDKPAGPTIRLNEGSGVDIEKPPFGLAYRSRRELCRVNLEDGTVVTVAYELQ